MKVGVCGGLEEAPTSTTCPPVWISLHGQDLTFTYRSLGINKDLHSKSSYKQWTALIALRILDNDDKSDFYCIEKSGMNHMVERAAC